MAARLEIEIGGTDKGGNSELKETIGLLERLMEMRSGLQLDLIKADTVAELRSVGENLTGVNLRISEYIGLASKATQAWRDNKTDQILDNLATKAAIANTSVQAFGVTVQGQTALLRAHQQAFQQLIENGLDRTDTRVLEVENSIRMLTQSIEAEKRAIAEQKAYTDLDTKLKQISTDSRLTGDAMRTMSAEVNANQSAITALVKAGVEPADARIKALQQTIAELNSSLQAAQTQAFNNSLKATGSLILDAERKVQRLAENMRLATNEEQISRYGRRLAEASKELDRLNSVGGVLSRTMNGVSGGASAFGTEIARIVQDAPYATKALGAMQNNFGAIGNNITRATELWSSYIAGARAVVIANGGVATSSAVAKEALRQLTMGATPYLLAISFIVSAIQVWTALSDKQARELKKQKEAEEDYMEVLRKKISLMDAVTQAQNAGGRNAVEEATRINVLRQAIENELVPRKNRLNAIKDLKASYPEYFKNLSNEELLAGRVADVYQRLSENLMRTALAQAAVQKAVELGRQLIDLNTERFNNLQKIGDAEKVITKNKADQLDLDKKLLKENRAFASAGVGAAQPGSPELTQYAKLGAEIKTNQQAIATANADNAKATAKELGIKKEIANLTQYTLDLQIQGVDLSKKSADKTQKQVRAIKELGEAISKIYNPDTDLSGLGGGNALDEANARTLSKFQELTRKVNVEEEKQIKYYQEQIRLRPKFRAEAEAEISKIVADAAAERKQIEEGQQKALNDNLLKYNTERNAKIAELEGKASISRIKNREQELAADRLYWDGVERNAVQYGITAEQLAEYRKSSEAKINEKWDQKMIEDSFIYQRRENESRTQLLIRQLNKETELKLKALQGDLQTQLSLQKSYFQDLAAIRGVDAETDFLINTDIDVFALKLKDMTTQANLFGEALRNAKITPEQYATAMQYYQMQREQVSLLKSGFDSLTTSIGDGFTGVLFGSEGAMQSLGEAFKKVAQDIIAGLVKIALRYAINQALGVTSMATTAAASAGAAAVVSAAWATPAALVSAATFGANVASGSAALLGFVGATKGLAAAGGFYKGGYTGNVGRREVAGVVHGQEFVMNAAATRDYMPLLRAMNSGRDISMALPRSNRSVNFGQVEQRISNEQTVVVTGSLANNTIKLSNDRGQKFNRKFGRG